MKRMARLRESLLGKPLDPQAAINSTLLVVALGFGAGLLFGAANTGFLGRPAVLDSPG